MMILNEELYIKNLLLGKNKDIKSAIKKIGYITRYNTQILNKNEDENYYSTVQWMNKHQDNFDESSYSNVISKAIKGSKKLPLYRIDSISITKNEFETIKSLNNIREEIDNIDKQLVDLFVKRMDMAKKVAEEKKAARISLR